MSRIEFRPFADDDVDPAGALLGERQAAHRAIEPLVPAQDPRASVDRFWRSGGVAGSVAIDEGAVVAFLLAELGEDAIFGRYAWVEHPGHAARDAEVLRDLYAEAAASWVADGFDRHYVLVPAFDEALDPWRRLGFHHMHVEAIRESGGPDEPAPEGVSIRPGLAADLADGARLDLLIADYQALPPSFARVPIDRDRQVQDWLDRDVDRAGTLFLVAEREGRPIGHAYLYPLDPSEAVPEDSVYLARAAVDADARGLGVGRVLTARAMRWAASAGYRSVVTNWRITNLSASRFWPDRGFRPTFHRMHRAIGIA